MIHPLVTRHAAFCAAPIFVLAGMSGVIGAPHADAAPCPASMTFVVGGTGDPNGVNTPGVPPGPRTNVWYPATVDDHAQAVGRANLTAAVTSFRGQCPGSHVTAIGYSGGAQVVGDWRDANPGIGNANVILVSDPRAPQGIAAMLPSVPFWWTNQGPRPASPIPTSNICRTDDPICNLGNPLQDPIHAINTAIGWVQGAHGYSNGDVNPAPGQHTIPGPATLPEVVRTPIPVPTPRQLSPIEPFVGGQVQQQWTPPAVARGTAARNVGEVIPPALAGFIPPQLAGIPLPH